MDNHIVQKCKDQFSDVLHVVRQESPGEVVERKIIIHREQPPKEVFAYYDFITSGKLGMAHILIGVLCVCFQSGSVVSRSWGSDGAHGFWGAVVFIICGSFGLIAAKHKDKPSITAFFAMAVFSCVVAFAGFVISAIACSKNMERWRDFRNKPLAIFTNAVLCMLLFVELGIAIWSVSISSIVVSCCSKNIEEAIRMWKSKVYGSTQEGRLEKGLYIDTEPEKKNSECED